MEENTISKSKQKREKRAQNAAKKKRDGLIARIIGIVIAVALIGLAVFGIVRAIIKEANTISASGDYSAQLDDNGYIKGIKATDYVTLCDYKNIEVPSSEVTYTDEEFNNVIEQNLAAHQVLKEEGTVADGDKVNIDYVGSIDGVEFEGGNSQGAGYDLTIGSGQFIEGFESQLIGHKAGEDVTVKVTFPEDYGQADLAGKPAEFAVTIHGIYADPEYNDDFVKEYYSDDVLKFEGGYLKGEKNGKGKEYDSKGKLKFEGEYLNGKRKEYNCNEELEFEGEYLNEERWNGNGKEYNSKGELEFEREYLNGKRKGKIKEYYSNGILKFEGGYLNGKRNGEGKEYNSKGKLKFEGEFINGKRNGKGKEYDSDGELEFEGEYLYEQRWNGKGK